MRAADNVLSKQPVWNALSEYRLDIFGMRIPFVRPDISPNDTTHAALNFAARVNHTLRALEMLSFGKFRQWGRQWGSRVFHAGDLDSIGTRSLPSTKQQAEVTARDSPTISKGGALLLARVSSFWREFHKRFEAFSYAGAFGDESGAIQCEFSSAGYAGDDPVVDGVRRGDVFGVADFAGLERISLPRVDPVCAGSISPRVGKLFENWEGLMLQKNVDKSRYSACRAYDDPFFRTRAGKSGRASRLWHANMLRFTERRRGLAIRCFCVVQKVDESGIILSIRHSRTELPSDLSTCRPAFSVARVSRPLAGTSQTICTGLRCIQS